MEDPIAEESGRILCLVIFGKRRTIISEKPHKLLQSACDKFGIRNEDVHLQVLNSEWNEYVDVLPEEIKYKSKVRLVQQREPHFGVGASPSRASNEESEESSSRVEPTDEVEGASKKVSFRNVRGSLLTKLRKHEELTPSEIKKLSKKVFHIITEHTFFPSQKELLSYIRNLMEEFPVLKKNGWKTAKGEWLKLLQKRFLDLRREAAKREQKPKVEVGTQTGMGNKPWQVWHPEYQKLPDNLAVFQDMSPIVLSIKQEFQKSEPDMEKIERLMSLTYQYRRSFIINMAPKVSCVQEVYPALFCCNQVCKEFIWITGKDNDKMFFNNLENYARIIYDLTKGCSTRSVIDRSIQTAKSRKVPYNWKTAALLLLPLLFRETHSFLWFQNQKFDAQQTEPFIKCNATLKAVAEGDGIFQVYAEGILLAQTDDFATAMECFLASFFIFMIEYRADLKSTLQLLQSFFFEYDDPEEEELLPRVIELAEKLKDKMKQQNRFVRS